MLSKHTLHSCFKWLAIADEVRTRIIASNGDSFIPEFSFSIQYNSLIPYKTIGFLVPFR